MSVGDPAAKRQLPFGSSEDHRRQRRMLSTVSYLLVVDVISPVYIYIYTCIYLYRGKVTPTDKTRVVSTRRRVPTNWVSGRTLQPSIESVVANSFVPSDFLVDG